MATSANALRYGGPSLTELNSNTLYAVGERTAVEARAAGFHDIRTGPSDGRALVALMEQEGVLSALHLCGAEHVPLRSERVRIRSVPVYRSVGRKRLPKEAIAGLTGGMALVLIHSPRAGALFARLCDEASVDRRKVGLAAISNAALESAGTGWRLQTHSFRPRDDALLELAVKLCEARDGLGRT
jgi:uroporphyrinogen-III synthase